MTHITHGAPRRDRMHRRTIRGTMLLLTIGLSACGTKDKARAGAPEQPTLISTENISIVDATSISSGPSISGQLSAEKSASMRAEVQGSVVSVSAEVGQQVKAGTVLARIDATTAAAGEASARIGLTSSQAQANVAKKELDRAQRLLTAGAIAEREFENARVQYSNAMAQLASVRSGYAQASKQLQNATVRAPFNGVVATKSISQGDVVAPGAPLFTVVDPTSMRLEAAVPAAQIGMVRVGLPVMFTVSGYGNRKFVGVIMQVSPVADPNTRQVAILASIPNSSGTLVGGLFAQGRVNAESRTALVLPSNAIDQRSATPAVMRLRGGRVERVSVTLGIRDEQRENFEITSGVQRGDTVLLGAAKAIGEGSLVRVSAVDDQASKATTPAAAARTTPQRSR